MDAGATGLNNGSSWINAYTDLQTALDNAVSGDEIWVAAGIYTPTQRSSSFTPQSETFLLLDEVALYGGFAGGETLRDQRNWVANLSILSGDIDGNDLTDGDGVVTTTANIVGDNAYHVVTGSGLTRTAILDGFTVTGGSAVSPGVNWRRGGGMFNDAGSPTVRHVTFIGNIAQWNGGGMENKNGSNPLLIDVTFDSNIAQTDCGGGMHCDNSSPELNAVAFVGNSAPASSVGHGGGLCSAASSPVLTDSTFISNTAGGVGGGIATFGGSPRLTRVDFISNTAGASGGGMYNGTVARLTDVTFQSNSAESGGGLTNGGGAVLINVTFVDNTATARGGGMDNNGGSPVLVNVRFLGNTADRGGGMGNYYNGDPSLTNSIFVGNRATSSSEGGGGMFNDTNCDVTMTNVSFVANSAARWAGAIWSQYDSEVELANGILWGNTSDAVGNELFFTFIATHTVEYSDLQEVFGGTGNISTNPQFVDADGPDDIYGTLDDDLRLQVTSPAIDAGDNDAVPADTLDLDGDTVTAEPLPLDLAGRGRFADQPSVTDTGNGSPPIVDMGAYERGHYIFLPLTLRNG